MRLNQPRMDWPEIRPIDAGKVHVCEQEQPSPFLSSAEVKRNLAELYADKNMMAKVTEVARSYGKTVEMHPSDLVNEAVTRAFSRNWPRHLQTHIFLNWVMKSVASQWYREKRGIYFKEISEDDAVSSSTDLDGTAHAREMVKRFDGDDIAQKVIICIIRGEKPEDTCRQHDLNPKQYASARRRITRELEKLGLWHEKPEGKP